MFKSNLEMCWNNKVNFADPLQYRRGPPGARGPPGGCGPPVENPWPRRWSTTWWDQEESEISRPGRVLLYRLGLNFGVPPRYDFHMIMK